MGFRGIVSAIKKGVQRLLRKPRKKPPSKRRLRRPPLEVISAPENPRFLALPDVPVLTAVEEFSSVQLSAHTARAYRKDLQDFFIFLKTRGLWEQWNERVGPVEIASYRQYLLQERKLEKATITRKLAVLKSFFKWSKARGWVADNPAELVKSFPQTQDSKTGFLSDSEVRYLLARHPGPIEELRLTEALSRVLLETLLMLGVRRSEAAGIRVGHLERLDGRWLLKIHGKGDRERRLPMPERLLDTWTEWLRRLYPDTPAGVSLTQSPHSWSTWIQDHRDAPLLVSTRSHEFGRAISTAQIAHIVRRAGRACGFPQKLSPHMLRATAITHALDEGASHRGIQQMAGWTSPLMISRYDKRKNDPHFSAVNHLRYARRESAESKELSPSKSE